MRHLTLGFLLATTALFSADEAIKQRGEDRSRAFLNEQRSALGLSSPDHAFQVRKTNVDDKKTAHVRLQQTYKGVNVFEGEAIAHVDAAGDVTLTDSLLRDIDVANVTPTIPAGQARAIALRTLGVRGNADVDLTLEILAKGERTATDRLTWHANVFYENAQDGTGKYTLFLDAHTGQPVWGFDALETSAVAGLGNTMFSGQVNLNLDFDLVSATYYLRSATPDYPNLSTRDLNGATSGTGTTISNTSEIFGNYNFDLSDRRTAGADAHYGMSLTWNYFKTTFGRNGIDGLGTATYGRVHYGSAYQNAFWSNTCFCMTYGDGGSTLYPLVSLDVTGHEMAHGVMSKEANLTYSGESGGLNESSSDIFGTLVEYYANNSLDVPDYLIGERLYKSNWSGTNFTPTKALRYMNDPAKDGSSPACWSKNIRGLNVHYSSGPNNHMFYLLAQDGTNTSKCNGKSVTGVGRDTAAKIWYKAISDYMTASTNYAGARKAALNAAVALGYAVGSSVYNSVAAAYSAINVN